MFGYFKILFAANYTEDILTERLKITDMKNKDGITCNCLPLCADLTYNVEASQSNWDWSNPDEIYFDSFNKSELAM